jgi:anaerobic selenocysteine-containing dehydrogenase
MASATISTTCPLDCPDTCSLNVTVEEGKVGKITGSTDDPVTAGFICSKVSRFGRRLSHVDRVLYPKRRVGAKGAMQFERISWEAAIAEITDRFRDISSEWGGEAILPYHYGGSNGVLTDGFMDSLYFARLGASRLAKTVCAAPTTAVALGMYGKMPGVAFEDYPHAKCIVVWGANPKASSIHFVPFLKKAKAKGAFIAVVDPRLNFSRREIDLHLPVLPGADLPLALGLIRWWKRNGALDRQFLDAHAHGLEVLLQRAEEWTLERTESATGVPASDIEALASRIADADPAVVRCGWGLERNRNGGQAVAAVLAIPALLGKFGVRGGGYTMSNSGATSSDVARILGNASWSTREINMSQLGEVLTGPLAPPIKGLFVYNCNPAATVPHQRSVLAGLAREDLFTVVFEQVMTDTAAYADVVLPATTFLEHHDVRVSYGNFVVGGVRPAIAPNGEARPNATVFAELGKAMGFVDDAFHWEVETHVDRVAEALHLGSAPVAATTLREGGGQRFDFPGEAPIQFQTVHPRTADGKIDLSPPQLGDRPYHFEPVVSEEHPLALITPGNSKMISSTFGEFNYPELQITIHPDDAARRRIAEGSRVRVHNELGEVVCKARVSTAVRPGVVSMPKGAWRKSSQNGFTSTALCPAHVNVVGGGACYNDARVEVELAV